MPSVRQDDSRARILASAGRGFRTQGFGGLGIDGLAKGAGVTSGAFYASFASKAAAFRDVVRVGMADLADGIAGFRASGPGWFERFVDFYLGARASADLAESCALQSLSGDVARADAATREAYTSELQRAIGELAGVDGNRATAIAALALLSGGVSMARAVDDGALAAEITAAIDGAARTIGGAASPSTG